MIQDVLDVALLVAEAIDASGSEHFIGGSVASSLQGEPRDQVAVRIRVLSPDGAPRLGMCSRVSCEIFWRRAGPSRRPCGRCWPAR